MLTEKFVASRGGACAKMNAFLKKLRQFDKLYFTISDLLKIGAFTRGSLYVTLSRLVQRKELMRLTGGVYILPEKFSQIDLVGNALYQPSYLSFESALSRYGLLSQVPYTLTFATTRKSYRVRVSNIEIEYRKIREDLFFGYKQAGSLLIASRAKAVIDSLYFVSFGKASVTLDDLDLRSLDRALMTRLARKFPDKTQRLLTKVLNKM